MFERFNVASRLVIRDTYSQAGELNHHSIGPEHILLSLVEDRSSTGAQLLSRLGCFPNKVRAAILSQHPRSAESEAGGIGVSTDAKRVLQGAVVQADEMGSAEIGPEHILLALLKQPSSTRDVLINLGVKEADLRTRIKSLEASSQVVAPVAVGAEATSTAALKTEAVPPAEPIGGVTELSRERLRRKKVVAEDYSSQWAEEDDEALSFEEMSGFHSTNTLAEAVSAVDEGPRSRREWIRSIAAAAIIVVVCLTGLTGIYFLGRDGSSSVEKVTAPSSNSSGQVLPAPPAPPQPEPAKPDEKPEAPTSETDSANGSATEETTPATINFGLPEGAQVKPSGEIVAVPGDIPAPAGEHAFTYDLSVDSGLEMDVAQVSRAINQVLNDPRGWAKEGYTASQVTSGGQYHFFLVSSQEVDRVCSADISQGYYSCTLGNSIYLNADRWYLGDESFIKREGTLDDYRIYLLNRQLGLALGKPAQECAGAGQISPAMEPQTKSDSQCKANGWPYPGQN